jgi:hypothetical protein
MSNRYQTPEQGTLDWHIPLNENFAQLDTDVEIRDQESNRSTYTPRQGAKFFATDTGEVYLGDGQAWTHVGAVRRLPGDVFLQADEPSDPSEGDIWIDTGSN